MKADEALLYIPGLLDLTSTMFYELMNAENMGKDAIKAKYEMLKNSFKNDYVVFTQLMSIVDYRKTTCFEEGKQQYADVYKEIMEDADRWQKANFNHYQRKYIRDAKKTWH